MDVPCSVQGDKKRSANDRFTDSFNVVFMLSHVDVVGGCEKERGQAPLTEPSLGL